jgi:hypothetical protein
MNFSSDLIVQIKQKGGIGVETPSPRSILGGLACLFGIGNLTKECRILEFWKSNAEKNVTARSLDLEI